jgi:hypothetical protein
MPCRVDSHSEDPALDGDGAESDEPAADAGIPSGGGADILVARNILRLLESKVSRRPVGAAGSAGTERLIASASAASRMDVHGHTGAPIVRASVETGSRSDSELTRIRHSQQALGP